MPSFDNAWAAANAACDTLFGEEVTLSPKTAPGADPNARKTADASRAQITAVGIFSAAADAQRAERRGFVSVKTHHVSAARPTILISAPLAWVPRNGDTIALSARTPVLAFEIVEVHRHENNTTLLEVTPI